MSLSQVGWTTAIVSCMASRSVKFQNYRWYRTLLLALLLTLLILPYNSCTAKTSLATCRIKRLQFKILLLTFKAIHGLSPPYISELITVKPESTYSLRSNNSTLLRPPTQKLLPTLGARSFAAAAPALWNKLPADIRNVASFK